jgi:membrane protein
MVWRLLWRAVVRAFEDNCFEAAKGAAFSAMLSFFPGLLVAAAVLIRQNVGDIVPEVSRGLARVLPPDAHRLATQYLFAGRGAEGLLVGAGLVAVWSASGVILSLKHGLHAAYKVPEKRGILHSRLVALLGVLLAGTPLLAATTLLVFGHLIEAWLLKVAGAGSGLLLLLGRLARTALALGTCVTVLGMVYRFVPNRKQRWKFVWPGAAAATVLWWSATLGFTWYVSHVARYRDFYGSLTAVVVLLIWSYIVSLLVLIGGEFNAEYERAAKKRRG